MAKINIPQGSSVSSSPNGRSLFTDTRLGSIGNAVTQFGNVLTDETVKSIQKRNAILEQDYITNSVMDSSEKALRLKDEMLKTRVDPKGLADDYMNNYDEMVQSQLDNAPSENAKSKLKGIYAQERVNNFKQMFDLENQQIADNSLAKAQVNIDNLAEQAYNNPDSLKHVIEQTKLVSESVDPFLDDANLQKFNEKAKLQIIDRSVNGLMNTNINRAIKLISSKEFREEVGSELADSYLKSAKDQQKRIVAEANRQKEIATQSVKVDRQIAIFNGEITQTQLDKDLKEGKYGKSEYLSLSKELRSTLKSEQSVSASIENVRSHIDNNRPLDTTNPSVKKDLDRYFERVIQPTLTKDNFDVTISNFMDQTGYIPAQVKDGLLAGLNNGSDEQVASSAVTMQSLIETNPRLVRQFSEKDLVRAKTIGNSIRGGMDAEQAIKGADNMLVEYNSVEYKERRKAFKNADPSFDSNNVQSFFRNDPNNVPESMKQEWKGLVENYSVNLKMSISDAEQLAYEKVNSKWGISNVTGEPTYVKHAPEKYYNTKNLDPIWIEKNLRNDVYELLPNVKDYNITVDPATMGTETPGYYINYVNKDGIPLILRNEEGRPLVWRPDINTSIDAKNQLQKAETELSDSVEDIIELQEKRYKLNIGVGIK